MSRVQEKVYYRYDHMFLRQRAIYTIHATRSNQTSSTKQQYNHLFARSPPHTPIVFTSLVLLSFFFPSSLVLLSFFSLVLLFFFFSVCSFFFAVLFVK